MKKMRIAAGFLILASFLVLLLGPVQAVAKYPEKEVSLICPWPPGGSSDTITRAVALVAKNYFPKPMIVVNRDGANGMIATAELVRTKPDGYTIAQGAGGLFLTQPFVQKKLEYKQDDFDFLIGLTNEPMVLTVNVNSPYKSLEELIKGFKEKNQVIRYSNSGMGGFPHLCPAYLFGLAGVQSQPIPFKGGAPAITAILGGHVDVCSSHPGEAYPHIKAGKLRPLAISSLQRFSELPDVPTMKEKGYNIDMGVKKFIFAPKGLSDDVRKTLTDALAKVANDPAFKKTMADNHLMLEVMNGKEVVDYFNTQAPIMKKLIEDMAKVQTPASK